MPGKTSIEWTATHNPDGSVTPGKTWNVVTGCTKVSAGCDHCYAETFAERFRGTPGHPYEQGFDLRIWEDRLTLPLRWKTPCRIFVNSMSDWAHEDIPEKLTLGMFHTMLHAPHHTYQLLTKRAPRMVQLVPQITDLIELHTGSRQWPPHIWMGVTVESDAQRGRIAHLRKVPSAVRFISYEPALGPLTAGLEGISWVIAGAESGAGHATRPMTMDWVRAVRDQCQEKGIAFFLKQDATPTGKKIPLPELDGRQWVEYPTPREQKEDTQ